jgi:hypothetical protein
MPAHYRKQAKCKVRRAGAMDGDRRAAASPSKAEKKAAPAMPCGRVHQAGRTGGRPAESGAC